MEKCLLFLGIKECKLKYYLNWLIRYFIKMILFKVRWIKISIFYILRVNKNVYVFWFNYFIFKILI